MIETTRGGCPCGTDGPCCDDPEIYSGHDEFCDCEDDYCDYRWFMGCCNCGRICGCEV